MGLTRDQILEADDLKREVVNVPEWGGEVIVRTMTGTERDSFELSITEGRRANRQPNLRALLAALTVVSEDGGRLFSESDAVRLGLKSASALDRIFGVAARLNGIGQGDVEEMEKKIVDQPWRMFLFSLALRLGMTVRQLLAEADSRELSEWQAYFLATREGRPKVLPAEAQADFFKARLGGK